MNKLTSVLFAFVLTAVASAASATVVTPAPLALTTNAETVAQWTIGTAAQPARNDILVDFTIRYTGAMGENDFAAFWFGSTTGPNIGLKADCGNSSCANDLFGRMYGNSLTSAAYLGGTDMTVNKNEAYRVFGRLYKSTANGNYDRFALWLNPTAAEMAGYLTATPDALAKGDSGYKSFTTVGLRTVNLNDINVRFDNVQINAVPEPGTLSLMGLAVAGMAAFGRRRNTRRAS